MDILPLLDELRTIARNGLTYATGPYDRERYERLFDLTCRYYGQALDLPPEAARARLAAELGYITPKVGADAAIVEDDGRILLVRRADDGRWCLPGGWVARTRRLSRPPCANCARRRGWRGARSNWWTSSRACRARRAARTP